MRSPGGARHTVRRRLAWAAAMLTLVGAVGCTSPEPRAAWAPPSREELASVRARLDDLRSQLGARTEEIAITLEAPLLPGAIRARGAIAVVPGRAARVVLLGPGGTTAADLWMDRERHRLAVPARDTITRGKRGESLRGMPLELFRTWFLEPLDGELLDASVDDGVMRAVLRTRDATVFVRAERDDALVIERVPLPSGTEEPGGEPDVEIIRAPGGAACARVTYERPRLGVRAEITCASRKAGAAERAMRDPDAGAP
jgi:hypothetical protein